MGELGFKCFAVVFLLLSRFVFPARVLFSHDCFITFRFCNKSEGSF